MQVRFDLKDLFSIFASGFRGYPSLGRVVGSRGIGVGKKQRLKIRGVAQLGSVLAWGARGRRFKSGHPDKIH